MANMRVQMIMDLVANTRKGAQQAKRDIGDVKGAAKSLDGVRSGERISRDFLSLVGVSRRATGSIRETKGAADALGRSDGPRRLSRAFRDLAGSQRSAAKSMQGVGPAVAAAAASPGLKSAVGGYLGARAVSDSVKQHAEAERAITRIGITADAAKDELASVGETAFKIAQDVAMPYAKVVEGLDILTQQGRTLKESMDFLPAVASTASAAGAEVDDIARTADSISSNFKIASKEMQNAFDIMAAGGKAGQFELKDMARYLPSLAPAAAAAGFKGEEGLRDMVAMLQVIRKGTGTAESAAASMENIFQKMESQETAKRFEKMGINLEEEFKKARKEGRNLIEVFEELTKKALKGDLSKIPTLFQDQEFARGMRALLTYFGQWQKLSKTIGDTAPGSVVKDLAKVTDNVQAKLDRLANHFTRRMRQVGATVSDILIPLDKKLEEIAAGKNETANRVEKAAQAYNADIIAREEMRTGYRYDYDPETRRVVDARRALLERQAFDDTVAKLNADIAAKEAEIKALSARTQGAGKARQDALLAAPRTALSSLEAQRNALVELRAAIDEANVALAENEAQRRRFDTRFNNPNEAPKPISPGLSTFGFGPQGQKAVRQQLPPRRPDSLPKPAPVLNNFDDIYSGGKVPLKDWASTFLRAENIDFSGIGLTMAETVASGLKSGTGSVSAAAGSMNDAVRNAAGVDLTSAGQQAAESYAAGLRKGAPAVAAAAQSLGAAAVSAANRSASRGKGGLSGALHDGVE